MTATQTLEAPNFGVMSSCSLWTGARDGHTSAELDAVAAAAGRGDGVRRA
jgi:hypothetical protein